MRYKVQFTPDQAYVDLLERARNLLWHQLRDGDLAQLQHLALEALVEKLMARKWGSARPKAKRQPPAKPSDEASAPTRALGSGAAPNVAARERPALSGAEGSAPARWDGADVDPVPHASRHIPADVRRLVWERDGGRCSFIDSRGVRCRATRAIEFHHEHPYAKGGTHCAENVRLRCRAHNELAAEADFGRERMLALTQDEGCTSTA